MAIDQSTLFNNVPDEKIFMNEYDLSFDNIFTTEIGRLTVGMCRRVLPGETWKVHLDMMVRTMPLLSPVYGKMDMYAHAFYCTNRSLSTIWENYIRNGEDGEHYDPNDPESQPYEPDLLKVSFSGAFDENSDSLDFASIINVSCRLSGYSGTDSVFILGDYDGDPSLRFPFTHGSLMDYLNINSCMSINSFMEYLPESDIATEVASLRMMPFKYSLLPFKAYQSIWSEYYADANIMTYDDTDTIDFRWMQPVNSIEVYAEDSMLEVSSISREGLPYPQQLSDETIVKNLFKTRHRCFAKDYFTSSLPEPQRGPDVLIPIDADISIKSDFKENIAVDLEVTGQMAQGNLNNTLFAQQNEFNPYGSISYGNGTDIPEGFAYGVITESNFPYIANNLRAELSSLSATITDLRTAVALQEFYESSARYGNRYKEFVYGHFGSMIPDDQLTRPWYLGGLKIPIQISDVMQNSTDSNSNLGVGNIYGKGLSATDSNTFLFERKFDDYGLIMVIFSIRPHNYYKNTLQKEWLITDRLDEYWRKLQSVGEEEVVNMELSGLTYTKPGNLPEKFSTFGYQMRYSNYKFSNDEVHGDFKDSISYWTMCRDFSDGVTLSPEFLEIKPQEFNHIFQYEGTDVDHFLVNSHFTIFREAPMDIYSIPRIN